MFDADLLSRANNALRFTIQLALGYALMLVVMTLNGYIILSVLVGVWVGSLVMPAQLP